MTAWGSVEGAVEAMRRGARDYIQKPWDNQRLLQTLRTQIELGQALRRSRRLEDETSRLRASELPELVAESRAMQPVLRLMERVAPSDANVLITGEHGTGKEVVARWLHAASRRAGRPFVAVNAGGVSEGVFESELFGHVKGAFTDAKHRPGRLLRAGRRRHAVPRRDRQHAAEPAGQAAARAADRASSTRSARRGCAGPTCASWRPPTSTWPRRWPRAASARTCSTGSTPSRSTCRRCASGARTSPGWPPTSPAAWPRATAARRRGFSPDAMQALLEHPWPGNVRELEHVVERALLLAQGNAVEPEDLALRARGERDGGSAHLEQMTLEEVERHLIQRALARAGGQVSDAAHALGLSRSALYRRLQHHGIKGSE